MHSCIHAFVHSVIQSFMHSCIRAFMHSCIHAFMHSCFRAFVHSCIHAFMHSCIHAYMHSCIHACIHSFMHSCMHSCIHAFMHSCIHGFMHAFIHSCMHAFIHSFIHATRSAAQCKRHMHDARACASCARHAAHCDGTPDADAQVPFSSNTAVCPRGISLPLPHLCVPTCSCAGSWWCRPAAGCAAPMSYFGTCVVPLGPHPGHVCVLDGPRGRSVGVARPGYCRGRGDCPAHSPRPLSSRIPSPTSDVIGTAWYGTVDIHGCFDSAGTSLACRSSAILSRSGQRW